MSWYWMEKRMIKEEIKRCLEKNVEMWQKETNSLPKISYDEDVCEWSDLFVGQPDTDGSIQWQYAPVDRIHVLIPEMEY